MKYQLVNKKSVSIASGTPNLITSVINVTDVHDPIADVNVTADINQPLSSNPVIHLKESDDSDVMLVGNEDREGVDFALNPFDDNFFQPFTNVATPSTSRLNSEQSLKIFNDVEAPFNHTFQTKDSLMIRKGSRIFGAWKPEVVDKCWEHGDSLNSWSIGMESRPVS